MERRLLGTAICLLGLARVGVCASVNGPAAADLVIRGAQVVTMDVVQPQATAVAVRDGEIVYVGDDAGLQPFVGPRSRVVEGAGMTVLPGLHDSHGHVAGLGLALDEIDLRGEQSASSIVTKVKQAAQNQPKTSWLIGRGWDQNRFTPTTLPGPIELAWLDAAAAGRPVILRRIDGHAVWVNSEALRRAGISNADCSDPPGGRILRAPKCDPTGVLVDNAMALVEKLVPSPTVEELESAILKATTRATERGLTAIHDMGVSLDEVAAYHRLVQAEKLPLRVFAYHHDPISRPLSQLPQSMAYRAELDRLLSRLGPPEVTPMFSLRGIKLYMDGALGSRGAALDAPYSDELQTMGLLLSPPEHIEEMARWAALHGYQIATHAIGDHATHLVLDAYEHAGVSGRNLRFRIEHAQVLMPSDLTRHRFRDLGVIASVQPSHATSDMPWAGARLGADRLKSAYAYKSLLRSGARVCAGSDFPVEELDSRLILHAAVTRQDGAGNPPGGFLPGERLTVAEAISAMTTEAAYAAFAEDRLGRISVGKLADLTVISGNLPLAASSAPPEDLLRRDILFTIVGGRVVYDGTKPAAPSKAKR